MVKEQSQAYAPAVNRKPGETHRTGRPPQSGMGQQPHHKRQEEFLHPGPPGTRKDNYFSDPAPRMQDGK